MNANGFDALVRSLVFGPFGRRRLLAGAAGSLLATLGRRHPAAAAKMCCGTAFDCGDCTCSCAPDGSFTGCCCGTSCPAGPANAGACCQPNNPTCCGGLCCALGQVCVKDGTCGDACAPGTQQCGSRCCDPGASCTANGCGLPPPQPPPPPVPCSGTTCNGYCCAAGVVCDLTGLACAVPCEGDLRSCGGTCILPCGPGLTLNSDTCACECPGVTVPCGEGCANLKTDRRNCGQCGNACKPGQRCSRGHCRKPGKK